MPERDYAVIDAQVHVYEHDHPARPWTGHLPGPNAVSGADMLAAMDAAGVDGALVVSPWSLYRYDTSYVEAEYARHSTRLRLIKPFDPDSPTIEHDMDTWAHTPGAVGARIVLLDPAAPAPSSAGIRRIVASAARHGLPVNVLCWGRLSLMADLAERFGDATLLVDHLGLVQPFTPPIPRAPFAELEQVLALARFPHVAVKITGAGTLSRQGFPFRDIREPVRRIVDAFGIERCLWGSDWTRATAFLTYPEAVTAFDRMDGFTRDERALLMGGNLARIYGWSP